MTIPAATGEEQPNADLAPCTICDLSLYFLRLGTVGFGGPIALAGYMQKDLVEERRWIHCQRWVTFQGAPPMDAVP